MAFTRSREPIEETSNGTPRHTTPRRRFSTGHLVMVGAGLVGVVLTLTLLRQADAREDVAVAASPLVPGVVLDATDVRWTGARLDPDVPVIRRGDLERYDGMVIASRVAEGELLAPSDLRPSSAPDELRALSVPIPRSRAVNGALEPGDRVDVIAAGDRQVRIVVAGVEVLEVAAGRAGALAGGVGEFSVTLAVDAVQAQHLSAALSHDDLVIARSTGADAPAESDPIEIDALAGEQP